MTKRSKTPPPNENVSTNSLEESGELVDLSSIELDDSPESPYGKHLRTIILEVFENKTIVREVHGREEKEG